MLESSKKKVSLSDRLWYGLRWFGLPAMYHAVTDPVLGDVNNGVVEIGATIPAYGGPSERKLIKLRKWLLCQDGIILTDGSNKGVASPCVIEPGMRTFRFLVEEDMEEPFIEKMELIFGEDNVRWGEAPDWWVAENFHFQLEGGEEEEPEPFMKIMSQLVEMKGAVEEDCSNIPQPVEMKGFPAIGKPDMQVHHECERCRGEFFYSPSAVDEEGDIMCPHCESWCQVSEGEDDED